MPSWSACPSRQQHAGSLRRRRLQHGWRWRPSTQRRFLVWQRRHYPGTHSNGWPPTHSKDLVYSAIFQVSSHAENVNSWVTLVVANVYLVLHQGFDDLLAIFYILICFIKRNNERGKHFLLENERMMKNEIFCWNPSTHCYKCDTGKQRCNGIVAMPLVSSV